MSSIIEFKHKYGKALLDMNSIKQISIFEYDVQCDMFIDNTVYSFDAINETNKVYEEIKSWKKENK